MDSSQIKRPILVPLKALNSRCQKIIYDQQGSIVCRIIHTEVSWGCNAG